jgi:hypothetical protein
MPRSVDLDQPRSHRQNISRLSSGLLGARGEVFGRFDRGSKAASPSRRRLASSSYTHDLATPYLATTSATDRFPTTTAVITNRAFDMPEHPTPRPASPAISVRYVVRHPSGMC